MMLLTEIKYNKDRNISFESAYLQCNLKFSFRDSLLLELSKSMFKNGMVCPSPQVRDEMNNSHQDEVPGREQQRSGSGHLILG